MPRVSPFSKLKRSIRAHFSCVVHAGEPSDNSIAKALKTKKPSALLRRVIFYGAPEEIRTPGLQVRSLLLYPAELRAREKSSKRKPPACQAPAILFFPFLKKSFQESGIANRGTPAGVGLTGGRAADSSEKRVLGRGGGARGGGETLFSRQ